MMPDATVARSSRKIRRICGIEQPRVIDGRGSQSHLFRRLVTAYVGELGGEETLSEFDKEQVAQLVTIECRLAALRRAILEGHDTPSDELIRLSSEHRRILKGLRAKAKKPAGPTLAEYLARKYPAAAAAEPADEAEDGA